MNKVRSKVGTRCFQLCSGFNPYSCYEGLVYLDFLIQIVVLEFRTSFGSHRFIPECPTEDVLRSSAVSVSVIRYTTGQVI